MRKVLLVLAVVVLGSASAGGQTLDPASEVIVTLSTERFDPPIVQLRRGVRLTFHNLSASETLSIVSADGAFESWPLGKRGQWSHTFSEAGRFEYFLKEHPEVRGVAEVR